MFVQVIKGEVGDAGKAREALDHWLAELADGATGWLGSTSGVTDDGILITLARFDSEENARRNSDRLEQGAWWAETEKIFTGPVTFADSVDVQVDLLGDPDQAGFVQVMQGSVSNPERVRELMQMDRDTWRADRPELLGTVAAIHEGNTYTTAAYFTSEAEAREGEKKEPSAEMRAVMEEMSELFPGETVYYDLKEPWLDSPK